MNFLRIMAYWDIFVKAKDIITNRIGLKSHYKAIAKEAEETPIELYPQMVREASPIFVKETSLSLESHSYSSPTGSSVFFNTSSRSILCPIKNHLFEKYIGDWAFVLDGNHNRVLFLVDAPWIMVSSKEANFDEAKNIIANYYRELRHGLDRYSILVPESSSLLNGKLYTDQALNKEFTYSGTTWVRPANAYRPDSFSGGKVFVTNGGVFYRFRNSYVDICSIFLRRIYKTRTTFNFGLLEFKQNMVTMTPLKKDDRLHTFVLKEDLKK